MWLILSPRELHHIDVTRGRRLFAGRLARTTGTGMSTRKDTVGSDVVALDISGNTLVSWPLKQSTTACLLANSSPGARRPSLWLERTGMNRFLPATISTSTMIGRVWPFHFAKISAGTGRVRVFLITSPEMRCNDSVAFNIQALLASARLFEVAKSITEAAMTTLIRISPRYYKKLAPK